MISGAALIALLICASVSVALATGAAVGVWAWTVGVGTSVGSGLRAVVGAAAGGWPQALIITALISNPPHRRTDRMAPPLCVNVRNIPIQPCLSPAVVHV